MIILIGGESYGQNTSSTKVACNIALTLYEFRSSKNGLYKRARESAF